MSRFTKARSHLALAHRNDPDADHSDLRRDLKAAKLGDHIDAVAPELTTEQRLDLAALLVHDVDAIVRHLVEAAPPLSAEQVAELRRLARQAST